MSFDTVYAMQIKCIGRLCCKVAVRYPVVCLLIPTHPRRSS